MGRHAAHLCEFDDLPGAEAQLFVIVQHCVHVLYPDGIHWPIKHVPFLVGVSSDGPSPDEGGENPICPVTTREERAVGARNTGCRHKRLPGKPGYPADSYLLLAYINYV